MALSSAPLRRHTSLCLEASSRGPRGKRDGSNWPAGLNSGRAPRWGQTGEQGGGGAARLTDTAGIATGLGDDTASASSFQLLRRGGPRFLAVK